MLDFIVNPMARRGSGVEEVNKAVKIMDDLGISYALHYTEYRHHATELAYDLTMNGADTIVSCGGDGTIHEIINGIIPAKYDLEKKGRPYVTKLALLPCGTGNDFMRSAGISVVTEEALRRVISGEASPIDAINIDGTYEICFACRGIDVDVVNMVNASKKKTPSSYLKKILICIFKGINYDFDMIIDGKEIKQNGIVAAVLNGSQLAGGMHFCPPANIDDGCLDVIFVKKRGIIKTLLHFAKILGNNFIDGRLVTHCRAKSISITASQNCVDIDGELYENKKFDAKIAPNVINLIR